MQLHPRPLTQERGFYFGNWRNIPLLAVGDRCKAGALRDRPLSASLIALPRELPFTIAQILIKSLELTRIITLKSAYFGVLPNLNRF
jgi:hypothetical protein